MTVRVGAIALAAILLVSGCTAGWEDAWTEHHPGIAPAESTAHGGPAPGILTELWRIDDVPVAAGPTRRQDSFVLESGNLLTFTNTGVHAVDAATGRRGWSYREPARIVRGMVTDGVVVLSSTDHDGGTGRLVGLDAADGKLLWQRGNDWRTGELPLADGVIPALPADKHASGKLTGIDVHTGEIAWETEYSGCGIADLERLDASDGSLILVNGSCAAGLQWDAFDPKTGELLWTQQWDPGIPGIHASGMSVVDGTTLSNRGEEVVRIDSDGTVHDPRPVSPGSRYGAYQEIAAAPTLSLRDLRTGRVAARGWPSPIRPPAFSGEKMYYLNHAGVTGWLPQLVVGDLASGKHTSMPLPGSVALPANPLWTGVAGGRLLIAEAAGGGTVSVLAIGSRPTGGPVELGGVPLRKWPDPCELLAAAPFGHQQGQPDEREPAVSEGGSVDLPRQQCVRYLPSGDRLTVSVPWVAATEQQAAGRLGGRPGPHGIDELTNSATGLVGTKVARIGTVFVAVWSDRPPVVSRTLKAIADRLRS